MPYVNMHSGPAKTGTISVVIVAVALMAAVFFSSQVGAESVGTGSSRLVGSGSGPYQWGNHVTVQGFDWNGKPAAINTVPAWKDKVVGVAGGRWGDQIDYTSENGGKGESVVISFDRPVSNVTLEMGMVGTAEGGKSGSTPIDESGRWTALDRNGKSIAQGRISPDQSALGARKKRSGSYGLFPITVQASTPIYKIRIEATAWGSASKTFADRPGSTAGGVLNNSDIGLSGVKFSFAASASAPPPPATPAKVSPTTIAEPTAAPIVVVPTTVNPDSSVPAPAVSEPVVVASQVQAAKAITKADGKPGTPPLEPPNKSMAKAAEPRAASPTPIPTTPTTAPITVPSIVVLEPFLLDAGELSILDGVGRWSNASVTAQSLDGSAADLTVWKGVVAPAGGRYEFQIDIDTKSDRSEQLSVDFDTPVVMDGFSLRFLEVDEYKGFAETGVWQAFDSDGALVDSGMFAGSDTAAVGGVRTFTVPPVSNVSRLVFEPTHYGHGAGFGRFDNQSDFALKSVSGQIPKSANATD